MDTFPVLQWAPGIANGDFAVWTALTILNEYLRRSDIKFNLNDIDDICDGFSKTRESDCSFADRTYDELDEILFGLLTNGVDSESKKKSGSERTPNEIIAYMIDIVGYDASVSARKTIIDPACGTGTFIKQIVNRFIEGTSRDCDLRQLLIEDQLIRAYDTKLSNVFITKIVMITSFVRAGYIHDFEQIKMLMGELPVYCRDFLKVTGKADYIIGNPPYIRLQNLPDETREYIKANFRSATGRFDIFACFIEHGDKLLNKDGRLCLITSNKYLTTNYGAGIREYLAQTGHVRKIVDLFDTKFFGAAVLPAIILCENSDRKDNKVEYIGIKLSDKSAENCCKNVGELFKYAEEMSSSKEYILCGDVSTFELSKGSGRLPDEGKTWNFSTDSENDIKSKMEHESVCCLQDLFDVCVGIKTTADTVFVKPMTFEFIQANHIEKQVIYPLIQSFDVDRWSIRWGDNKKDRYILYPHKEEDGNMRAYPLEEIPNAASYLNRYADILKGRKYLADTKTREWYECWVPQKLSKFRQTKIVTRDIVSNNAFAIDDEGRLCQGNTFFLTLKDSLFTTGYSDMSEHEYFCFILGLLNSEALEYYQKMISGCLYSQKYRYTTSNLNRWPIPGIDNRNARLIAKYVDDIIKHNGEIQRLEEEINNIVFRAFHFTDKEIKLIEAFVGKEAT